MTRIKTDLSAVSVLRQLIIENKNFQCFNGFVLASSSSSSVSVFFLNVFFSTFSPNVPGFEVFYSILESAGIVYCALYQTVVVNI